MIGEVSEVATAPRVEPKMQPGPELPTLNTTEPVLKTADKLQEGLNRGVEPETLMKGFVEGVYDWVDENVDNVNQGGNDKQPRGEPEKIDTEAQKSSQVVVPKEQVQPKETPEQQFQKAVQEHREKYGLQADNLEGDPRFVQIKDQLMAEWLQKNPEPGQGKEELTDREKDQWRDWVNKKLAFQDTINQRASEIFRTQFGEDFDKYQKYGVCQSLEEDPRFQSLLEAQRRRFTKIAEHSGNIQAINQAEVEAKKIFSQMHPEVSKIYALKNPELANAISPQTKPPEKETSQESSQDRQSKDQSEIQEEIKPQQYDETQKTENKQLERMQQQIQELQKEIALLKQQLSDLRELEEQAKQILSTLEKNGNKQEGQKQEKPGETEKSFLNLKKLLEILGILLAAGAFGVLKTTTSEK